jgi:hypothetical protein
MTLEQAKMYLLTPPPSPPGAANGRPAFFKPSPLLLTALAATAGLLISRPARVRGLARSSTRVMRSPLVKRALLLLATQLAAKRVAR